MTHPALSAHHLSAGYPSEPVLRDISLSVARGEWLALIGPNGSGKSTLFAALTGSLAATGGQIMIDGKPRGARTAREQAKVLALLPQSPPPPAGITVRELVMQGRHPHRGALRFSEAADRAPVAEAIALVGLAGYEDRYVERLSGGERQRAWMAMTIAQAAPIWLLDEPTTFLDLGHQFELLELIHTLREQRGLTVITVLHDINQAARFADRLLVLNHGTVIADGAPSDVITTELLREHFGVEASVSIDDVTSRPVCAPRAAARSQ